MKRVHYRVFMACFAFAIEPKLGEEERDGDLKGGNKRYVISYYTSYIHHDL